ncbi:MAG: hypothetical protein K8J08_05620 [Thermoanaerobaculia bacterium]|nr:hypothetical protein [Thermoanaerobaculia bacterium]
MRYPAVSASSFVQDRLGFLWVGSQEGLYRFDGSRFRSFRADPTDARALGGNYVRALLEDSDGYLWVGTYASGLNRFDPATETFVRFEHSPEIEDSLPANGVLALLEDDRGRLWVGTYGGGLARLDLASANDAASDPVRFERFLHDPASETSLSDNTVQSILQRDDGSIWVATWGGGLNEMTSDGQFRHHRHDPSDDGSLSHDAAFSLLEDDQHRLWVGTWGGGLNLLETPATATAPARFRRSSLGLTSSSDEGLRITSLVQADDGSIWAGVYGEGLCNFDPETPDQAVCTSFDPADPTTLSNANVFALYEDRQNLLWVGNYGVGVDRYDPLTARIQSFQHEPDTPHSLSYDDVMTLVEGKDGSVWIGTDGGGLDLMTDVEGSPHFDHFRQRNDDPGSLSHDSVFALLEDQRGEFWVGTFGGGLNRLVDSVEGEFQRYPVDPERDDATSSNSIWSLAPGDDGSLWIGTYGGGLDRMRGDPLTPSFTHYRHDPSRESSLSHDFVTLVKEDRDGNLWVGTDGGGLNLLLVNERDRPVPDFVRFRHRADDPGSLPHDIVYALHQSEDGTLWIGTMGGGLSRFEPGFEKEDQRFTSYRVEQGLAHDNVYGIVEDRDGILWLATGGGVSRFDPKTESFLRLDQQDGLGSKHYNPAALATRSGWLIFGGNQGLDRFRPEAIRPSVDLPPVRLTELRLFNEPVPVSPAGDGVLEQSLTLTRTLDLSYRQSSLTFEFAALSFRQARENRFAYQLVGFDDDWVRLGPDEHRAVYTNLPAGAYDFRVRASNHDGVWNEAGTSLEVRISPPWWRTWWAMSAFWATVLGSLASFYLLRVSLLERQKRALEQKVRERTAEILRQRDELADQSQRLEVAHSRLLELDHFKDEMTGMIAHDLKNPLNVVLSLATSNPVLDAGRRMLHLVRNLLDVQKFEDAQMELERHDVALLAVVDAAVEQVVALASGKSIRIENQLRHDLGARIDSEIIERVFVNLLANAVKYTPPRGLVTIEAEELDGMIQVAVRDTGPGISEDQLEHVFSRFGQARPSGKDSRTSQSGNPTKERRERVGSTGLGLTFCRLAVEAHGGTIHATSQLGNGSTFLFTLPRADAAAGDLGERPGSEAVSLTPNQKVRLEPLLESLRAVPVYRVSQVTQLIDQFDLGGEAEIVAWHQALRRSIDRCDAMRYQELLDP